MGAPAGAVIVTVRPAAGQIGPVDAVSLAGPLPMVEGWPGSRKGTTGLAQRHKAGHAETGKQGPLTVTQRMPPCRTSLTRTGT
jgi:hypothetical protein